MSHEFSLTTFSPSGKLTQIEYALNAVGSGKAALGIRATNGVVIATEKKPPSNLVDEYSVKKINVIEENLGMTYAGLAPDARVLVAKARKAAQKYSLQYVEKSPVGMLVREVASIVQEFTQSGGVRPFGVSLLLAGYDDEGPQLYQIDPSGSYWAWKACAIGKNMQNMSTFLEKRYNDEMELQDAIHNAILTLKEGFDGDMTEHSIEIGIVEFDKKKGKHCFRVLPPEELRDYLSELQ